MFFFFLQFLYLGLDDFLIDSIRDRFSEMIYSLSLL